MIKIDKKKKEVTLSGTVEDLLTELGNAQYQLMRNAAEVDGDCYAEVFDALLKITAINTAKIASKYGFNPKSLDDEDDDDLESSDDDIDELIEITEDFKKFLESKKNKKEDN